MTHKKEYILHFFVEDTLTGQFALLEKNLEEYLDSQDDKDYRMELEMQLQRCRSYKRNIFDFLKMNVEDSVYWVGV